MGNSDIVIVFNNGLVSFLIKGNEYETINGLINIGLNKWEKWLENLKQSADYPEEINYGIKSINLFEV
jgi:hypothetical protein